MAPSIGTRGSSCSGDTLDRVVAARGLDRQARLTVVCSPWTPCIILFRVIMSIILLYWYFVSIVGAPIQKRLS